MTKTLKPRCQNRRNNNLKPEDEKHLHSDDDKIIIENESKSDITKSDDLGLTLKDYNTLKNIDYTDVYRPSGIITTKEYEKLPSPEIESFEIWDYMGDDND